MQPHAPQIENYLSSSFPVLMFFHWSGNSKTFNGKLTKYFRIGFNIQILRRKGLTIAKPSEYGMTTIIVHFKILTSSNLRLRNVLNFLNITFYAHEIAHAITIFAWIVGKINIDPISTHIIRREFLCWNRI